MVELRRWSEEFKRRLGKLTASYALSRRRMLDAAVQGSPADEHREGMAEEEGACCDHCGVGPGRPEWVQHRGDHHRPECPPFADFAWTSCRHCGVGFGTAEWVRRPGDHHLCHCPKYRDYRLIWCKYCDIGPGVKEWISHRGDHHKAGCERRAEFTWMKCRHCGVGFGTSEWIGHAGAHHHQSCPRFANYRWIWCSHCGCGPDKEEVITRHGDHHKPSCPRHCAPGDRTPSPPPPPPPPKASYAPGDETFRPQRPLPPPPPPPPPKASWPATPNLVGLLRLLELPGSTSDVQEVRRAYRRLSLRYHPDKNAGREELATRKFVEIADAYKQVVKRLSLDHRLQATVDL